MYNPDILDLLDEPVDPPKQYMTSEELKSLITKRVKFWEVPEDAEFLGGYFSLYHDVSVYRGTDGVYYSVWFSIGD